MTAVNRARYEYYDGCDDTYETTIEATLNHAQGQHLMALSSSVTCPKWPQEIIYTKVVAQRGYDDPSGFICHLCAVLGYEITL